MDDDAMQLKAAKQQLRAAMKHKLRAIPPSTLLAQSVAVRDTLKTLPAYADARRISVFLSMPTGEVQTDAIVRDALAAGKEVFVPYLHAHPAHEPGLPKRVMDMVRLRDLADYESLRPDAWGIPSIDPATVASRRRVLGEEGAAEPSDATLLDLVLVPGVAFDADPATGAIRRLGHGKGFYDYFFFRHGLKAQRLQTSSPVLLVGLALSEQFLAPSEGPVPVGPLDQELDGLVLGSGEIKGPLAEAR
ncbi:hypothetical protein VTJ83DRAFT_4251 [Remersonia thermophila]|uniref:5-formyltetrahydrofolate cyclo-ligase n=1 Tax=Remersonia thermophila TaxID=72144 RepID=A0ABR4DAB4_9PEZI